MKTIFVAPILVAALCLLSCSKKDKVEIVSGTVNGIPAITLYGSSNKPADYIFLSSDSTQKAMSYNGEYLTYVYTSAASTSIFILKSSTAVARAELIKTSSKTTLTIDTAFGFNFASTQYVSY